jgi:hypothetical protein
MPKYVVTLTVETGSRITYKALRGWIEARLQGQYVPYADGKIVLAEKARVRSVDEDRKAKT